MTKHINIDDIFILLEKYKEGIKDLHHRINYRKENLTPDEILERENILTNSTKALINKQIIEAQTSMADNLIDQEIELYKIYNDDRQISVGIKIMADRVREYCEGGEYAEQSGHNPDTIRTMLDHLLVDLAYNSQYLSERYEFEESILHEGTHLNNAKRAILDHIEANYEPKQGGEK